MKVINLFAGPGAGKSTTAAGLFSLMKLKGLRTELVTEVAKELVYERGEEGVSNQLLLFAKQDHRLRRLKGKVDYAITDSPLPLQLLYARPPWDTPAFGRMAMETWADYDNVSFLIERTKPYAAYGRYQDETGARELDLGARSLLSRHGIPFHSVPGDELGPADILTHIERGGL